MKQHRFTFAQEYFLGALAPSRRWFIEHADARGAGQHSLKEMAAEVGQSVHTIRYHRNRLAELGVLAFEDCGRSVRYHVAADWLRGEQYDPIVERVTAHAAPDAVPADKAAQQQYPIVHPAEAPGVDGGEQQDFTVERPALCLVPPTEQQDTIVQGTPREGAPSRATSLYSDVVDSSSSSSRGAETQLVVEDGDRDLVRTTDRTPEEIADQILPINNPVPGIAEGAREAPATLEERCAASDFRREDWAMLDAGVARMDALLGARPVVARPAAPVRQLAGVDPFGELAGDDLDLANDFGAAAGSGGVGLDGAPKAPHRPTAAPQRPSDATEALLARLRELVRGEAVAWLPQRPAGGVDADAVRRDVAAVAAKGATVARLAEVVAAARPAGGETRPWRWVINTLKRNPTRAPASAGGARRTGRQCVEVRPDRVAPAARTAIRARGW